MGVVRLVLSFVWPKPACGEPDDRPGILKNFHYMYYALLIFWIVVIVDVIVSLVSAPLPSEQVREGHLEEMHLEEMHNDGLAERH